MGQKAERGRKFLCSGSQEADAKALAASDAARLQWEGLPELLQLVCRIQIPMGLPASPLASSQGHSQLREAAVVS